MKNRISCFNICIIIQEKEKIHAFKRTFSFKKFTKFHAFFKKKKRKKSNSRKNSCIPAYILIQKIHMHSYMHSSKIIKKKIKFYAFINAFSFKKKNNIKKANIIHAFKHTFSFRKFTKFHAFINAFFKKKRTKSKSKRNSCIQACILIQKIHTHSYMHSSKIIKQKKSSFMHS